MSCHTERKRIVLTVDIYWLLFDPAASPANRRGLAISVGAEALGSGGCAGCQGSQDSQRQEDVERQQQQEMTKRRDQLDRQMQVRQPFRGLDAVG